MKTIEYYNEYPEKGKSQENSEIVQKAIDKLTDEEYNVLQEYMENPYYTGS